MTLKLSSYDQSLLSGSAGKAMRLAMQMMVRSAEAMGADSLVDVSMAHVNSCFYSGQVGVDFAEFLLANGAKVAIPTKTNVGLVDLIHPELRPERAHTQAVRGARRLMQIYEQLGCEVVWTCAPYQVKDRPPMGAQIVGSESNAVAFYNSVLGARTNKYGDFLDICGALTGRVPYAGLHRNECRRGEILFQLKGVPAALMEQDIFFHVLGIVLGRESGNHIPVIEGLPRSTNEDQLKAISAAGAASGSVALFHAVGITPEARTSSDAFHGGLPAKVVPLTPEVLVRARDALTTTAQGKVTAVCLGTPHFSLTEFQRLVPLLIGRRVHPDVGLYVSTSRYILSLVHEEGLFETLEGAGVKIVVDTCTYFTPVVEGIKGRVMTNSGKWAYYAPGILDVDVVFGSLEECVETAVRGHVWRDAQLWGGEYWGLGA